MPVCLFAILATLAYLSAMPLRFAFLLRRGEAARFAVGVGLFEARFARRAAERRLSRPARSRRRRHPISPRSLGPLWRAGRYLLRHLRLDALEARGSLGLGDAALTALVCGEANALACTAAAAADAALRAEVRPDFSAAAFTGEFSGMLTVRAGHIILAAIIGIFDYGSGRLAAWTDTRLKTS